MIYLVCLLTGFLCLTGLKIHDTLNMHIMCNYVFFFIIFILVILLFKISDIDMVILFCEY